MGCGAEASAAIGGAGWLELTAIDQHTEFLLWKVANLAMLANLAKVVKEKRGRKE